MTLEEINEKITNMQGESKEKRADAACSIWPNLKRQALRCPESEFPEYRSTCDRMFMVLLDQYGLNNEWWEKNRP